MEVSKEIYAVFVYTHFERNGGFKRELCRFIRIVNLAIHELTLVLPSSLTACRS